MAYVEKFIAGVTCLDQTGQQRAASQRVSGVDARLWFAAADHAARLATKVGLLLASINDAQLSDGSPDTIYKYYVNGEDINDAAAKPATTTSTYNSNAIKVTYATTNAGIPVVESMMIPQRDETALTVNADGKSYDITASPFANMETQMIDTGLSSYGTAITALISAVPNDI
jgi:hypothetical protein